MNYIDIAYASEEGVETTTTTANEGIIASMGINSTLFIFQLVNFALVFCVLWFLILKPLTKQMTARQKMIDDSVENSKKIEEVLKQSEKKYQEKIDIAKSEANGILEKAKIEADQVAEEMKNKTKNDMEVLVAQAKTRILAEKDEMLTGLKKETAGLVVEALEKILSEKIDENKDKKLIAEALKSLE